jgi:hypothetical protein
MLTGDDAKRGLALTKLGKTGRQSGQYAQNVMIKYGNVKQNVRGDENFEKKYLIPC